MVSNGVHNSHIQCDKPGRQNRAAAAAATEGGSTSGRQAVEAGGGRTGIRRTGRPSANVGVFKLLQRFKF